MDAKSIVQSFIQKQAPITVELEDGRIVTISKFKVKQIPLMADLVSKVEAVIKNKNAELEAEYLKLKEAEDIEGLKAFAGDTSGNMNLIVGVIVDQLEAVSAVLSSITGLAVDEVMELTIDELAALVTGVVLLNKDFFTQKVLPALMKVLSAAPKLSK